MAAQLVAASMVGGECSAETDSTSIRSSLVSKPLALSVALSSEGNTFALDNAFALINAYICAD
jgi:hypothetical protein